MADASTTDERARRRALRPLGRLLPYVGRYRGMVAAAIFFLLMATAMTLALPLAVRRMIDHGFSTQDSTFIANYFAMLVVIAAGLALASAGRYYTVITLGERVVSDIRREVFAHVTALSPAFFDRSLSGEIVSRLAADTTQVKAAVGATAFRSAFTDGRGTRKTASSRTRPESSRFGAARRTARRAIFETFA